MDYEAVIGLEVHLELKTRSKIFCGCSTAFGMEPNSSCCPVCLGLPGSLPVLNRSALEMAVKAALALSCRVEGRSRFDRKNYFYPDLPKAYQISQYELPVARGGYLEIDLPGGIKRVNIERVHMEEEAGKLLHAGGSIMESDYSLVDYNRAGIPLLEIVTAPNISSGKEARLFLEELRLLLFYCDVSDCRMEEGSLRCDANISLNLPGAAMGNKVEVKNMNSFRAVEYALDYEAQRQAEILSRAGEIVQETRHWDEENRVTVSLRGKEEASDYRYFPEPDLPPLLIEESWVQELKEALPELPAHKRLRFEEQYRLDPKDVAVLTSSPELACFYEEAARHVEDYTGLANWVKGDVLRIHNDSGKAIGEMTPLALAETISLLERGEISRPVAREVLEEALVRGKNPAQVVQDRGLGRIADPGTLGPLIEKVLQENPKAVESYLQGKEKALGFLVGKVMAATRGRSDPAAVNTILRDKLQNLPGKVE